MHSIWHEKGNDFGEEILKTHYLENKHKKWWKRATTVKKPGVSEKPYE